MRPLCCTLAVFSLLAAQAVAGPQNKKDVIKSTHTVRGKVVGFEIGDYQHVMIETSKGEQSYFIGPLGLDYFLAAFAKKAGTFTIQVVDTYIPEAGGRETIERVSNAKIGSTSFAPWWKAQRKRASIEKLDKEFQPKIAKLTRNGG